MHADFRLGLQRRAERLHPLGVLGRQQRAGGVGHIDAFGAVALHQLGLFDQLLDRSHMRHHQKADRVHAERARRLDMLLRDVGLGAVCRDAHAAGAGLVGVPEVVHGADPRQKKHGDDGVLTLFCDGRDPLAVIVRAEAVVEGRAGDAVAVADLDRVDMCAVERASDVADRFQMVLVTDRVHAVAQRDVLDVELRRVLAGHHAASFGNCFAAQRSAVVRAAEVMMSRLPA